MKSNNEKSLSRRSFVKGAAATAALAGAGALAGCAGDAGDEPIRGNRGACGERLGDNRPVGEHSKGSCRWRSR